MEGVSEWDAPSNSSDEGSPRPDHSSDAYVDNSSPDFSNFSSCEGSDFDRYCSANSVLGSASICSSIGIYSRVGEEFSSEGYNSRGNLLASHSNGYECLSDGEAETLRSIDFYDSSLTGISTSSRLNHGFTEASSSCIGAFAEEDTQYFLNGHKLSALSSITRSSQEANDDVGLEHEGTNASNLNVQIRQNGLQLDYVFNSVTNLEANKDAFYHSKLYESDDSLPYHGSDDEGRSQFLKRSFKLAEKAKGKDKDMNALFLNSSVAFGSNDWDEFVHKNEDVGLDSFSNQLDRFLEHQGKHTGLKFEKEAEDIIAASFDAKNLTAIEMGNSDHVSAVNYETRAVDMQKQSNDASSFNTLDIHSVGAVDAMIKIVEDDSSPGFPKNLFESSEVIGYLNSIYDRVDGKAQSSGGDRDTAKDTRESLENKLKGESELQVESLVGSSVPLQSYNILNGTGGKIKRRDLDTHIRELPLIINGDGSRTVQGKDQRYTHLAEMNNPKCEVKKLDTFNSYDEMVLEMEEILLNSGNGHGSEYLQTNPGNISQQLNLFDDATSNASTSAINGIFSTALDLPKIDRVEVVGAKQKKGDVSFGERLVGVREYTIYQMKVCSGSDEWKVERRYRDFSSLYRQLKVLFTSHGLSLPSAWSIIDQNSRNFFGNASPNVVMERSVLIEDCLRSVLNSSFPFGTPRPLIMFLTPGKAMLKSGIFHSLVPQYLLKSVDDENSNNDMACQEESSLFGMTISLVVEIKSHKSLRQMLEIQHYKCAGCHRHLQAGKTLFQEFVQTYGWNRPRFCEYTGQLFCSSCHTNDTSVLPARVLHHWDFTSYPVSQLANAYLESIYDQPMLCVSAVNPFLFSRIPALLHVMGFRKKIGAMFPYIHCSFKNSIQKSLNFRRYLLEGNDFFALRDLVDLSKGPFAALPIMVENISSLILEHITQQCLICYDSGVPCAAGYACHDPSSLIFPFQEAEAEKCTSCASIFHKACYVDFLGCPCCNRTAISKKFDSSKSGLMREPAGFLENSAKTHVSNSSTGFFTNILTQVKLDKIWKPKNSSPVILMSSLSSTL